MRFTWAAVVAAFAAGGGGVAEAAAPLLAVVAPAVYSSARTGGLRLSPGETGGYCSPVYGAELLCAEAGVARGDERGVGDALDPPAVATRARTDPAVPALPLKLKGAIAVCAWKLAGNRCCGGGGVADDKEEAVAPLPLLQLDRGDPSGITSAPAHRLRCSVGGVGVLCTCTERPEARGSAGGPGEGEGD